MKVDGVYYCNDCGVRLGDNRVGSTCKSCQVKKQKQNK